jgi:hypothetical protein
MEDDARKIFHLPGDGAPETYVYDRVLENIDAVAARLTVSMQLPSARQEDVKRVVRSRILTNRDRHLIYQQVGDDLDFTAAFVVAGAFLAIWAQDHPQEVADLLAPFDHLIPRG